MVLLTLEQLASDIESRLEGDSQPVDSDLLAAEHSRSAGSAASLEGDFG